MAAAAAAVTHLGRSSSLLSAATVSSSSSLSSSSSFSLLRKNPFLRKKPPPQSFSGGRLVRAAHAFVLVAFLLFVIQWRQSLEYKNKLYLGVWRRSSSSWVNERRGTTVSGSTTSVIARQADQSTLHLIGSAPTNANPNHHHPLLIGNDTPFCVDWNVTVDEWWTRRPDWEVVVQNLTHQCFGPIRHIEQAALLRDVYRIQFPTSATHCQQYARHKYTSGSGWGVDWSHVVDGLLLAVDEQVPVHIRMPPDWQYAVGVCPTQDWQCYVLPLTNCWSHHAFHKNNTLRVSQEEKSWHSLRSAANNNYINHHKDNHHNAIFYIYQWRGFAQLPSVRWLLHYAMRGQTWLRHDAVRLAAQVGLSSPCLAIHVRRGDVVLHGRFSRRYHALSEYLNALEQQGYDLMNANLLLLTDDANAIIEATQRYSQYRWYYIDRPRHVGPSGGWEHQVPSHNPAWEVTVLHASVLLLQQHCHVLVHTKSNLADYYYAMMLVTNNNLPPAQHIDLDAPVPHHQIHNRDNAQSVQLSRSDW